METCGQILPWRRDHTVMGRRHDHVCKLERGHPASDPMYVPVHHCGGCTLCWESEPRPVGTCSCHATWNPNCSAHGKAAPPSRTGGRGV